MAEMVVTPVVAEAARLIVKRAQARGESVSEPVRKIAEAKPVRSTPRSTPTDH